MRHLSALFKKNVSALLDGFPKKDMSNHILNCIDKWKKNPLTLGRIIKQNPLTCVKGQQAPKCFHVFKKGWTTFGNTLETRKIGKRKKTSNNGHHVRWKATKEVNYCIPCWDKQFLFNPLLLLLLV